MRTVKIIFFLWLLSFLRKKKKVTTRRRHWCPFPILFIIPYALAPLYLHATHYAIGPGQTYENIGDAPLDSLAAGDTLLIHARPVSYNEKWVICAEGTESAPIVFRGMPDSTGILPIIDGRDAVTKPGMNFWGEGRGVVKVGGSNNPPDCMPSHIIIENLDIRSGREPYRFTGRSGDTPYDGNAAAVYLEKGEHITVRNCILRDCANGLFSSWQTSDVLVEGCHIHGNGVDSSIYEHNSYTESHGITFQFNRYGPLRDGCLGNNLKDRSAGCVIRYNWIEAGNRQLDLVDSDYESLYADSAYRSTFAYGNVLIETDGAGNGQVCHYGGDSGVETQYRKGTLHFYHNTVVSTRTDNTTLFRLSTDGETVDCRNNILYTAAAGTRLAVVDYNGTADLRHNWIREGWRTSHGNPYADVNDLAGQVTGTAPGFLDIIADDYTLAAGAGAADVGTELSAAASVYPAALQYVPHTGYALRADAELPDAGAFPVSVSGGSPVPFGYGNTVPVSVVADMHGFIHTLGRPAAVSVRFTDTAGQLVFHSGLRRLPAGAYRYAVPAYCAAGMYYFAVKVDNTAYLYKFVHLR